MVELTSLMISGMLSNAHLGVEVFPGMLASVACTDGEPRVSYSALVTTGTAAAA